MYTVALYIRAIGVHTCLCVLVGCTGRWISLEERRGDRGMRGDAEGERRGEHCVLITLLCGR